jgi:response regulator RpfG family c-di-GMP phosphodiesterase
MYVAVVDDQDSSLQGFTMILRRLPDVEAACFKKGTEALHWLGGVDPVFMVVNNTLADISGIDFVRRARLIAGRADTPVIFTTGKADRELRRTAFDLSVHAFLEKPINPAEFLVHALHIIDAARERADLLARLQDADGRSAMSAIAPSSSAAPDEAVIEAMHAVAMLHDPSIVAHLELAAQLAAALGREMKLGADELGTLSQAARVYDIGKVAIPQRILQARTPATPADRVTIEQHCDAGTRVLAGRETPVLRAATTIAQTHHERYDGSGYPRKLRGSQIPLFGRIVAVADALAGLLRPRSDRPGHSLAQAMEIVRQQSGTAYDPSVVNAIAPALSEISRIAHEIERKSEAS